MSVKGYSHMIRQTLRFLFASTLTGAAALLVLNGCGELIDGSRGDNSIPEVFIVNVPPDGAEFTGSPLIYWYGTDSDGKVVRYDYTVVLAAEVDSVAAEFPGTGSPVEKYIANMLNDKFLRWISVFVDSTEAGDFATQKNIRLYASRFPADCDTNYVQVFDQETRTFDTLEIPVDCISDTIPQYFFIRAIDNQDSASIVKYRTYKRRNHWPETSISPLFNPNGEYISLPRITETYPGIQLTWQGTDRLDFVPPSVPLIEFHWRLYGPFPRDLANPVKPTLADTLGREPVFESANPDPRLGVWVRDTSVMVYDLWRQLDSQNDPLNDTTITRSGWFLFVVTARDDAFISDETPISTTFQALAPKFERKLVYVDETSYIDPWGDPAEFPSRPNHKVNQTFYWNLVKSVYPEADSMLDYWWRYPSIAPGKDCAKPAVRCGNYVTLELLARHKMCLIVSDDVADPISRPGQIPAVQDVLRRYLEAGGMVWMLGRNSLAPLGQICQPCKERMFDFCTEDGPSYDRLACEYFDVEGMWFPGYRATAMPIISPTDPVPRIPASNDEFVAATLVTSGTGLPPVLEIDRARVDSMAISEDAIRIMRENGTQRIVGIPEVNFLVLGASSTALYIFESWRPGGPIPPFNSQSFMDGKPVAVRRVGPNRNTPFYKAAYFSFPLYFIKQEQSEQLFREMVDWFFLPFSQS